MAWNEPGKNRDPWGSGNGGRNGSGNQGGRGDQGPPDLDEVFRNLKKRLFGDGGGSGGGRGGAGSGQGPNAALVGMIAGVLLIGWLLSGFYTIDDAERGVVLRLGAYDRTEGPGLHWRIPWPVETVEKVNVNEIRRFNYRSRMLTKDENIVEVDLNVQYRVGDSGPLNELAARLMDAADVREREVRVEDVDELDEMDTDVVDDEDVDIDLDEGDMVGRDRQCVYSYPDYENGGEEEELGPEAAGPQAISEPAHNYLFNVQRPDQTLNEVTESAVREVVGNTVMGCVLIGQGRTFLELVTHLSVQETLNRYGAGIEVTQVNLQDVNFPESVQPAVEDAIKAREDRERLILEADAYRNDVVPRARGLAAREVEDARAYLARVVDRAEGDASRFTQLVVEYQLAPQVTRERIYLETMEEVLGRTPKLIIDSSEGSGNLLYLPMDELLRKHRNRDDGESRSEDRDRSSERAEPRSRDVLRSRGGRR
ncbi:FtsH protease activity modulator HflK [Natronospira bacteriovora]|uniref:Protein HflK n=1 Tax=Natronospira bacteriovora TaxID=3069753 RepID=A0ABU0W612_9GAMM|nr:FtsH protease activity modulator HflK [Natronospira sp. AB-CW4]MDQ2069389.1 FtsH protease activity modulator HflK [Natronospira sp. AB-CW4]